MTDAAAIDVEALRAEIAGSVILPDDDGWDDARRAWNLVADQRPALIVQAAEPDDVDATVRFAREHGLRVAPQSTGHSSLALRSLEGTILLRTARLDGVTIDSDARTAHVQAGALWGAVSARAAEHGLVALHGFSGTVGVAGYLLGGGLGWLARREGFASSHVRSFEVVTAAGEQLHVDAGSEPELFWALRGGGGGPAIVTSFEIELFPLAEAFAGTLAWPIEQAREIVHAYRAWIATVPDTVTSTVRLMRIPPLPEVPEPLRGKQLVFISLVFTGTEDEGNELVAPLRAVAPPYLDMLAMTPGASLGEVSGDPPGPLPGLGAALLLDSLSEGAVDAFVEIAGAGREIPLIQLEIRHLGGALRRAAGDAGAAGPLEAEALVYGVGLPSSREVGQAIQATLAEVAERMAPWASQRPTLLTFDELGLGSRLFSPEVVSRLAKVSATYDPDELLVGSQRFA